MIENSSLFLIIFIFSGGKKEKDVMYRCEQKDCNTFGLLSSNPKARICKVCGARYCSEECMTLDKSENACRAYTKEELKSTLALLGFPDVERVPLPKISNEFVWTVPGPIPEPVPKCLIPIREEKFFNLLSEYDKENVSVTDWHYITSHTNVTRFWSLLTKEQKQHIKKLIDNAIENK